MSLVHTLPLIYSPSHCSVSLSCADIRPIRVLRHRSHPLPDRPFVTARSFLLLFFLSKTHTHTYTHNIYHNSHYLPDLISSVWLSLELMSVTAHFNTDTVHPSSCLTQGFTLLSVLTHLNVKLRQSKGACHCISHFSGRDIWSYHMETTLIITAFPFSNCCLLAWISRENKYSCHQIWTALQWFTENIVCVMSSSAPPSPLICLCNVSISLTHLSGSASAV